MTLTRLTLATLATLLFSAPTGAQELVSVEPLGSAFSPRIFEPSRPDPQRPDQVQLVGAAFAAGVRTHFLLLSPGITDGKGNFVSTFTAGHVFQRAGRGVQTTFTYGNVGLEDGSADFDLFNLKSKVKAIAANYKDKENPGTRRYNVAGVFEQRHLQSSYDRTKLLAAADFLLTPITHWKTAELVAVANAGWGRKAPEDGDVLTDALFAVGLQAGLGLLGDLSVGVDYRFKNDVDGKWLWTVTAVTGVGKGSLIFGVERGGGISGSYLQVF